MGSRAFWRQGLYRIHADRNRSVLRPYRAPPGNIRLVSAGCRSGSGEHLRRNDASVPFRTGTQNTAAYSTDTSWGWSDVAGSQRRLQFQRFGTLQR